MKHYNRYIQDILDFMEKSENLEMKLTNPDISKVFTNNRPFEFLFHRGIDTETFEQIYKVPINTHLYLWIEVIDYIKIGKTECIIDLYNENEANQIFKGLIFENIKELLEFVVEKDKEMFNEYIKSITN